MRVTKELLLSVLPAYQNQWVTVTDSQDVNDIIAEIRKAHAANEKYYDLIGPLFIGDTVPQTFEKLVRFCNVYLPYSEESEDLQTVSTPQGLLTAGKCDCKGYASFIGGCLGAIKRMCGEKFKWHYCFASYKLFETSPYHVFVVAELGNQVYYLDPTPGSAGMVPVWKKDVVMPCNCSAAVNGLGELINMGSGAAIGATGTLIPAPHWYPDTLPKFYRQSNGEILLLPNGAMKYTNNDVLDVLLYYQTWVGYNRIDTQNAVSAAWYKTDGLDGAMKRVVDHFTGAAQGDYSWIPNNSIGIDGALYSQLQARYIEREKNSMPWLSAMQAKGGGIDLMTIPMATDVEISRPSWYDPHLPSLFKSAGLPYQLPAGSMNTKPKIRNGYDVTPKDVAKLMVYAQPTIYAGLTPYPMNWYVNDNVNGAIATRYKITLWFHAPFTNSQMQQYGAVGDMMREPDLSADPYASGFTHTLETIVSAAVSFFAGKIPGGTKMIQAAYAAGNIQGGQFVTGGPIPPGAFSAAVFQEADSLNTKVERGETVNMLVILAAASVAVLGWYYWE